METIAVHIHDALIQVRDLRRAILEKQRFKGYSGRARVLGGVSALTMAMFLSSVGPSKPAVLLGWMVVLVLGLLLNYGALLYWFLSAPHVRRDPRHLRPVLAALPSLWVGGLLSFALLRARVFWPVYGVWMTLYGLANLSARDILPRAIGHVGFFYLVCGTVFLLTPEPRFENPWPMGIVFFVGEFLAGWILHRDAVEST